MDRFQFTPMDDRSHLSSTDQYLFNEFEIVLQDVDGRTRLMASALDLDQDFCPLAYLNTLLYPAEAMLRPAPPAQQQQQQQQDFTESNPLQLPSTTQNAFHHKRNMSKGAITPFLNQNNSHHPFQGGQGADQQHTFHPPSTPVFVEDTVGGDDGNQALMRPPPAHRSPSGRAKWSPVVHTIAEAGESFSGTVFPAKLFDDDTSSNNELSPHDNNTDNGQEPCGLDLEGSCKTASPLAPSLEPNSSLTAREQPTPETKTEVAPALAPALALNDDIEEEQEVIPMEILLSEIQHLVAHDFGGPNKSAPYPTILKPLYQRFQDYHVMLKNARRKLDQHQQHHHQQRVALSPMVGSLSSGTEASSNKLNLAAAVAATTAATSVNGNTSSPVSTLVAAKLLMKHNTTNNNFLEVSTATAASSSTSSTRAMTMIGPGSDGTPFGGQQQLQQRIIDLEQQLAQSRRAHHTLLQDHILNLKKNSSNFLIGPPASGPNGVGGGGGATAKLPVADALAIHGILASVNSDSPSTLPLFSSSTTPSAASGNHNKFKKKKKDSSSLKKGCNSTVATPPNETFQEIIKTAQELHDRHIRQLKGLPSTTTTATTAFFDPTTNTNNSSTAALLSSSDSEPYLVSISSHHLITEATTRLLRAETELGLLKLVMAQNQSEISGLEEDVLRAQHELITHRHVFESLLELHQLGFEAQIREDLCVIRGFEVQVRGLEEGKEEVERVVKKLEEELAEKERILEMKRDMYHRQEQDLTQGPVQDLEAEIEVLKAELVAQEVRIAQSEEESIQMTEYLERQHRKVTAGLKASLAKTYRSNTRLQKEVSVLSEKMVSIESLNDDYAEQTSRDRAQLSALQQQTRDLQAQLDNVATTSSSTGPTVTTQQQTELKATIAFLETQIEDLSTSLRLKQEELDQALEETERLALKLDHDLAHQQSTHVLALSALTEKHHIQAQRERACQSASVILFQNMVTKLQVELGDTQEKLRDTTLCWGHTKEQLQKCEQSYRRRKKDLEETTRNLHELEETMAKLGDAIGMLEYEKEANMVLVRTLEERDREMRDMEYRLKVLEDERN
ncbi:hypothetical protein BGZ96_006764 [Linnemannia gamsii]|uniref:Up-regulated during septation protein 1 domain-containing protein n=1 Tax=Linnemannia gamsii TaxID=64522 RepID=A0ABQ7K1S9_9FUNG|nr:hypothetical protein BGZ96_006764 [Linnemannia gamsii]